MCRGDVEFLRQLGVGDHIFHILRQALSHVVVHFIIRFIVAIQCRRDEQCENHEEYREYFGDPTREFVHTRNEGFVLRFLQWLVQQQNH